jgi:hypothetical protein
VGPGGYDIYDVKFASGSAEFRIDIAGDGTIEDFNFRPDGDGSVGGIAPCASEPTLKSSGDTAPIRLALTNRTGVDIQLFELNRDGRRQSRGTLANEYSTDVLTNANRPLVITDPAGQCREIILPGLLTRVHVVEPAQLGRAVGHRGVYHADRRPRAGITASN